MPVKLLVCQSTSCSSGGSQALVRDIEELALGSDCVVEETLCLGRCGKGPNVEVQHPEEKRKIVEGVKTFKKALALVEDEAKYKVGKTAKNSGKLKWEVRRQDEDPAKRDAGLEQAIKQLGGQAESSEPTALSQLLTMRSGFSLRANAVKALADAEKAVDLQPKWAGARVALGNAFEACSRFAEAVTALQAALDIGGCIKVGALERQLVRLKRRMEQEQAASRMAGGGGEEGAKAADEGAAAKAKAKAKAKTRPKAKARNNSRKATSRHGSVDGGPKAITRSGSMESAPKDGEAAEGRTGKTGAKSAAEEAGAGGGEKVQASDPGVTMSAAPVFREREWRLESVRRLNHDCVTIELSICGGAAPWPPDVGDIWHVDILRELDFGEELRRSYTPLSDVEEYKRGVVRLMVKVYTAGRMTTYLAGLRPGRQLLLSPPLGTATLEVYEGLVVVAGGSCITVALQICRSVLARYPMGVPVHVIQCNTSLEDVLYQDPLDSFLRDYPAFSLAHCISEGPIPNGGGGRVTWKSGRIALEDLSERTPASMRGVVGGPPGLCQCVVRLWEKLDRNPDRLTVLDELPPPEAEDAALGIGAPRIIVSL